MTASSWVSLGCSDVLRVVVFEVRVRVQFGRAVLNPALILSPESRYCPLHSRGSRTARPRTRNDDQPPAGRRSPATMDRRLAPDRAKVLVRGRSHTKPGRLLKDSIPIRTWAEWNGAVPGFVEINLVGHEGGNAMGEQAMAHRAPFGCRPAAVRIAPIKAGSQPISVLGYPRSPNPKPPTEPRRRGATWRAPGASRTTPYGPRDCSITGRHNRLQLQDS